MEVEVEVEVETEVEVEVEIEVEVETERTWPSVEETKDFKANIWTVASRATH